MRADYEIIKELSRNYPVVLLCCVMNINRSSYYKWLRRKDAPNCYELNRRILTELIKQEHQKHKIYGYHKLAAVLRKCTDMKFSDNLIHKCCKVEGIRSAAKHYRYKKAGQEHIKYENILKNNWRADKALSIVASDMTCFRTKDKKYEWTYMIDAMSNRIITWSLSEKAGDTRPYYECLEQLKCLIKEQTYPCVLHTDQGSVYSSRAFNEAHKDYNIIRSMSRAGTPTDNPKIEALNGWIKQELYKDFGLYHTDDVKKLIKRYIDYYNYERPQFALNYLSPAEFELSWA